MFVSLPTRQNRGLRWATPLLFVVLLGVFLWATMASDTEQRALLMNWGALSGGLLAPEAWQQAILDGRALRLVTALFLHADWAHQFINSARCSESEAIVAHTKTPSRRTNSSGVAQRRPRFWRVGSDTNMGTDANRARYGRFATAVTKACYKRVNR